MQYIALGINIPIIPDFNYFIGTETISVSFMSAY